MGIEPTPPAWKAGALPLSYTRNSLMRNYLRRLDQPTLDMSSPPVPPALIWREQDSNL